MKNNCPCINCDARHVSCHSGCERYAAWKKQSAKEVAPKRRGGRPRKSTDAVLDEMAKRRGEL